MSKKQMSLIYYHITEDHDDPDTPNVFGIMTSKNNIRLQHLYDHFPLKGSYIFRFKVMYDSTIAWLDLPELDSKLPTFKEKIMVKATRISWQTNKQNPYGHYRFVKGTSQTTKQSSSGTSMKNQKASSDAQKKTVPADGGSDKKNSKTENNTENKQKKTNSNKKPDKIQTSPNLLDEHNEEPTKSTAKNSENFGFDNDLI